MKALLSVRQSVNEHGASVDIIEGDYVEYFESLGLNLHVLSNHTKSDRIEPLIRDENIEMIILTGGGDLASHYYDYVNNGEPQSKRDHLERTLITYALKQSIPILGVCRGMQHVHAHFGGKLSSVKQTNRIIGKDHPVTLEDDTVIQVNNYHNDGIKADEFLNEHFNVLAKDEANDIIEGFYATNHLILAIQWHPERPIRSTYSRKINDTLLKSFIFQGTIHEFTKGKQGDSNK